MFDIGFLEIMVILVVGLVVIGPERMPEVARKIGQFVGRTRRFIDSVKQDSEIQSAVNEIKEAVDLEESKQALQSLGQDLQSDLQTAAHDIEPLDFDQLESPFGQKPDTPTQSQFRKAPAMPKPPSETGKNAEQSASSGVETSAQQTVLPAQASSANQPRPHAEPEPVIASTQTVSEQPMPAQDSKS